MEGVNKKLTLSTKLLIAGLVVGLCPIAAFCSYWLVLGLPFEFVSVERYTAFLFRFILIVAISGIFARLLAIALLELLVARMERKIDARRNKYFEKYPLRRGVFEDRYKHFKYEKIQRVRDKYLSQSAVVLFSTASGLFLLSFLMNVNFHVTIIFICSTALVMTLVMTNIVRQKLSAFTLGQLKRHAAGPEAIGVDRAKYNELVRAVHDDFRLKKKNNKPTKLWVSFKTTLRLFKEDVSIWEWAEHLAYFAAVLALVSLYVGFAMASGVMQKNTVLLRYGDEEQYCGRLMEKWENNYIAESEDGTVHLFPVQSVISVSFVDGKSCP